MSPRTATTLPQTRPRYQLPLVALRRRSAILGVLAMAKNILIIEDETTLRELMRSQLERAGYEVAVASDGRRGLELARTGHPDLVLLDFLLPAKNGTEVLKE